MANNNKICCASCRNEFTVSAFSNHIGSKACAKGIKHSNTSPITNCPHCDIDVSNMTASQKANHVRWCKENPKHEEYIENAKNNSIKCNETMTEESITAIRIGISKAHKEGKYKGSAKKSAETRRKNGSDKHTEQSKEKIRIAALNSKHQRVSKKSHPFTDKNGRTFIFDSTWEDFLALRLDELDIRWERPEPIEYELDGKTRNYFPDFYLPDHDLYLDPKNEYCRKVQKEKLDIVSTMINLIILNNVEECKTFKI
jgi:hypothetical protein